MQGLGLLVNAKGSYLWLATFRDIGQAGAASDRLSHEGVTQEEQIQRALQSHIEAIVGGAYYSHYSGAVDEKDLATPEEQTPSLKDYQEKHLGILNFHQINTILEGLYNSSLDFRVFFLGSATESDQIAQETKEDYSLGHFIGGIAEPIKVKRIDDGGKLPSSGAVTTPMKDEPGYQIEDAEVRREATGFIQACVARRLKQAPASSGTQPLTYLPRQLYHLYLGDDRYYDAPDTVEPDTLQITTEKAISKDDLIPQQLTLTYQHTHGEHRADGNHYGYSAYLLRRFLRVTASESLLPLKRRIERCRRALLATMIEITHRHQPLLQVELPERLGNDASDENRRIVGVTESQLRGFIMLLSAKLPIIANVKLYLDELRINNLSLTESPIVSNPYRTWTTLFQSLRSDLDGLERAIQQAQTDSLVQEEREIRAEEETLTEIERLRARSSGSLSPTTSLALGVFANAFALVGVLVGVAGIANNYKALLSLFPQLHGAVFAIVVAGIVLALLVGLSVAGVFIYVVIHAVGEAVLRVGSWFWSKHGEQEERYYYEMDIHLDVPLEPSLAQAMFDSNFALFSNARTPDTLAVANAGNKVTSALEANADFYRITFGRNTYRTERMEENEAVHKIYIEADTRVRPNPEIATQRLLHFKGLPVHLVLVYELLFHRPSQEHRYVLQDLRVIINHADVLSRTQITELKWLVIDRLINPWITTAKTNSWRLRDHMVEGSETTNFKAGPPDALLSLNLKDDNETVAQALPPRPIPFTEPIEERLRALTRSLTQQDSLFLRFAFASALVYALTVVIRLVIQTRQLATNANPPVFDPFSAITLQQLTLLDIMQSLIATAPALLFIPPILILVGAIDAILRSGRKRHEPSQTALRNLWISRLAFGVAGVGAPFLALAAVVYLLSLFGVPIP